MSEPKNYKEINRDTWNKKTAIHIDSVFYNNEGFISGQNSINSIDQQLLGDIKGKSILHLQCHFGQDTISLARMGGKSTGVDIADKAIDKAIELAAMTKTEAQFICCDIYDLPMRLNEKFDIVYTSYGTIGWLPDITQWANVVAHFLKPKGRFIMVEFHPVVWMFDDNFETIKYRYFNSEPIVEEELGTYAEKDADIKLESVTWNHGLAEVVNSLITNGLEIESLKEYDYSPFNCFNNTIEIAPNQFRIKHLEDKIPMLYSIVASKKI